MIIENVRKKLTTKMPVTSYNNAERECYKYDIIPLFHACVHRAPITIQSLPMFTLCQVQVIFTMGRSTHAMSFTLHNPISHPAVLIYVLLSHKFYCCKSHPIRVNSVYCQLFASMLDWIHFKHFVFR